MHNISARYITCLLFMIPVIATASTEPADRADLPFDFLEKYRSNIDFIARELNVAKKHRTAIIARMEDISHRLGNVAGKVREVTDRQPSVRDGIADADTQIELLTRRIQQAESVLKSTDDRIENSPIPSIWDDALGRSSQKRRDRAIAEYKKFKAENVVASLKRQRDELLAGRVSLFESFKGIEGSVQNLSAKQRQLRSKRQDLERQFIDLSAEIVRKQDRQNQLQERLENLLMNPGLASFFSAKGNLPYPTHGDLRHLYAEPKAQGLLKWEGIVIDAPIGQEITAVFDGTVVFADQMQGLGNVAIIDHGWGYMSLYGMTDFLLIEPGDTVLAGDTVGTVGIVSERAESGLYFEIRHNADTLDPVDWLETAIFSTNSESRAQLH